MDGWAAASRWLQYLGLMLVFGLPAFELWMRRGPSGRVDDRGRCPGFEVALAVGVLFFSLAGFWTMAAVMVGQLAPSAVCPLLLPLLQQTAAGHALLLRLVLLLAWLAVGWWRGWPDSIRLAARTVFGGAALITLAWAGHGAMDDGWRGVLHLGADSLHLLAAGLWMGALLVLCRQARGAVLAMSDEASPVLLQTATAFAPLGSGIVLLLCVSGLINGGLMLGAHPASVWQTHYGELLLLKLGLFALMLMLAASHRFRQLPRLRTALATGQAAPLIRRLQASLAAETLLGLAILALVAWLGMLDPGT